MNVDENSIKLEKRLALRNIIIDKVIIGALIGIFVFWANIQIEEYKSTQTQSYFLLQNRLDAISKLRELHSKMHEAQYMLTFELPPNSPENTEKRWQKLLEYRGHLKQFIDEFNKWGAIFSDKLDLTLQYHTVIHQAYAYNQAPYDPKYWGFMVDVALAFDLATREALKEEVFGETYIIQDDIFQLEQWSRDTMVKKNAEEYFNTNWNKWQKKQRAEIQRAPLPATYPESKSQTE